MDNQVLGSLLESIGMALAAIISGICLFISVRRDTSRAKLKIALEDILVFNAIENELLKKSGISKVALRELMREQELELSGKHTPSVIRRKLQQLK